MIWRTCLDRFRRFILLKTVGTTAWITLFFVGYFHELRNMAYPVTVMPLTELDRLIGFQPGALVFYLSLWFYVGLPPALLVSLKELVAYGAWVAGLCVAGLACFHFWPTAVPPHVVDPALHPGFQVLQGIDAAGNACPSMHVATAAFSAIWLDRLLTEMGAGPRPRAINWIWFALIAWSTLAIKQHVALDVLAGLALGIAFAVPSLRNRYHMGQAGMQRSRK